MLNFVQPSNMKNDKIYKLSLVPFYEEFIQVLDYFQSDDHQVEKMFDTLKNNLKNERFLEELYLPELNYYINELKKVIKSNHILTNDAKNRVCQKILTYCVLSCAKAGIEIECTVDCETVKIIDNDQEFIFEAENITSYQPFLLKSQLGKLLLFQNDVLLNELVLAENPFLYYLNGKLRVKNSFVNEIEGMSIEFLEANIEKYIINIEDRESRRDLDVNNVVLSTNDIFYYRSAFKLVKDVWPEYYVEMTGTTKFLNILPIKGGESYTNILFPKMIFLPHIEEDLMAVSEKLVYECAHLRIQQLVRVDSLVEAEFNNRIFSYNHEEPITVQQLLIETFAGVRKALWLAKMYHIYPTEDIFHKLEVISYELSTNIKLLKTSCKLTLVGKELWSELLEYFNQFLEKRKVSSLLNSISY